MFLVKSRNAVALLPIARRGGLGLLAGLLLAPAALAVAPAAAAAPSARPLATVRVAGQDYARLDQWAAALDLRLRWVSPKELLLTNRTQRVRLTVDSREAVINGVSVWLSAPVAAGRGLAYVSALDLKTALQPILAAEGKRGAKPVRTVCIDPGHGGKDPGNLAHRHAEKKYTLLLAKELKKELTAAGLKVVLTRSFDRYVDLDDRPEVARKQGADLFISLHYNATARPNLARGVEVFCLTPAGAPSTNTRHEGDQRRLAANRFDRQNVMLAYHIQGSVLRRLGVDDRGLRRARFAVLRAAEMPAVLVEAGFMSDRAEAARIFDEQYRQRMARAIAGGVLAYKRAVDPPAAQPQVAQTRARPAMTGTAVLPPQTLR